MSFDEESAAIDNLVADLEEIDLTPLDSTGITSWIDPLKIANNDFKEAATIGRSVPVNSRIAETRMFHPSGS